MLGDRGIGIQGEVRVGSVYPRSPKHVGFEAYGFYDYAHISNRDRLFVDDSSRHLNSVGAGARFSFNRFFLDTAVAVPLTDVGLLDKKPDPRVLVTLTTRLLAMESSMTHQVCVPTSLIPASSKRRKLLWSCAAAAIVVAGAAPQKARAQAFSGTPTLPNPNIAVDGSASG